MTVRIRVLVLPATSQSTSSSVEAPVVAELLRDQRDDFGREVVADIVRQHLLARALEERQGVGVGVHVVAARVDLHRRARDAEEHAAQLAGLAHGALRVALGRHVSHGADHVGSHAGGVPDDDALVAHQIQEPSSWRSRYSVL